MFLEVMQMKKRKTRRISVTVPEIFYESLADQAELTGLSLSRVAWLRLKRNRCLLVPVDVGKTLERIERMLRVSEDRLAYEDRALVESLVKRIELFWENGGNNENN